MRTVDKMFTEDECQLILGIGLLEPLKPALAPGLRINPEFRSSMVNFLYPLEQHDWIFDRFWTVVGHEEGLTRLSFLQSTEYDASYGGCCKNHRDTDNFYHPTNTSSLVRKMTVVAQLTDPHFYEGGELLMYDPVEPVYGSRDRGSAIVFPSHMLHSVTKVTSGTRYSLVAWFEGPKDVE